MADWVLVGGYTNTVCSFHAGSNHRLSGAFPRVQRYNIIKVYQLCLWCTFFFLPFLPSPPPPKKHGHTLTPVGITDCNDFPGCPSSHVHHLPDPY